MSTFRVGRVGVGAAGAVAVVTLVTACASGSSSGTPAGGGQKSGLKSRSTSIGKVLVDRSGRTVYELVGDSAAKSTCTGECLVIWPAVMANGKQVVVNGHPAFTYVGDKSAGQTNGQKLKDRWGLWLALSPSGNPIGASARSGSTPASPSSPSSPSPSSSSKAAPGGGGPAF